MVSAAALIDGEGRVLVAQRPSGKSMAGLWEFPGGKVQADETPEAALVRELEEELGVSTRSSDFKPIAVASHTYDDFHLLMPLFTCRIWEGTPQTREHTALQWVKPMDLHRYDMPAADVPLVETLKALL